MRPDQRTSPAKLRGFAVASAIFILVVLAALSAFMVSLSTTQHATSAMDVQGSRAYWAARSMAEYWALQVLVPENEAGALAFANCPAVPLPPLAGLSEFTFSMTCERTPLATDVPPYFTDRGRNFVVYRIGATARRGAIGSQAYVERQFGMTAVKCKDPNATLADGTTPDPRNRC